jgi:hypothetical protein
MKYEQVEITEDGVAYSHIIIDNGDGSFKSFPADESNHEYVLFLAQIEAEETN